MNIIITTNKIPIYEQIYRQIKQQIIEETLTYSESLPSIRALAKELGISVITVRKSYDMLMEENLIVSIPGKGYYVEEIDKNKIQQVLKNQLLKELESLKQLANANGIDFKDILKEGNYL